MIKLFAGLSITALITLVMVITGGFDVGCHIIGAEVNGDMSTEYLLLGGC